MTPFNALPSPAIVAALRKSPAWITAAALLALVAGFAFFGAGPANAQGGDNDHVDVALDLEWPVQDGSARDLSITVMNHGARIAYDVEVVVDIVYPENSSRFTTHLNMPVGSASLENNKHRLRWTIPELGGQERETADQVQIIDSDNSLGFDNVLVSHEFFGKVTTSSFESDLRKGNNTDRIWFNVISPSTRTSRPAKGVYWIDSVSVDAPHPSPGDIVNFTIDIQPGIQIDGKVAIELTDGLAVDEDATANPPRAISIVPVPSTVTAPTYSNGVITIGTRPADDILTTFSATIPVKVASEAIVNEQCLTATITGSPPPGAGPYNDDVSDNVGKVCLGDPAEPFSSGQVDAFTVYPCVGVTEAPCDSTDDLRVRAAHPAAGDAPLTSGAAVFWLDPSRASNYDGHVNTSNVLQSVNNGNTVSWQTAVTAGNAYTAGPDSGVELYYSRLPFEGHVGDWKRPTFGISARDVDGNTPPPGKVFLRFVTSGNEFRKAESPDYEEISTTLSSTAVTAIRLHYFLEFEKLGTYKIGWHVSVPRNSLHGSEDCLPDSADPPVNQAFCASETYTFHVGPMAELEVRDGGASPQVASDQQALTIVAVNNGPDDSPNSQVTGLPTGAEVIHIGQGTYDSATGEWDIGELKVRGYYRSRGEPDRTLVLSASAGDTADVSIANSENYEVCIGPKSNPVELAHTTQTACEAETDASWNSTPVYDYKSDNNTATITAQAGTGGGGEGVPTLKTPGVHTPSVRVAWYEVDYLHGVPVKDYQVQWSTNGVSGWTQLETDLPLPELFDITIQSGHTRYYRVRAVNEAGFPGPWSAPMAAMAETVGEPGISVSETALTIAEGASEEYTVGLKVRPISNVTINIGVGGEVTANPGRLTFTPTAWETAKTVVLTAGQDQDGVDDILDVTHNISTSDVEYARLTVPPVAVTVIDDDSDVSIAASDDAINEGETVTFTLTRQGKTQNAVTVTVNVAQRGDFLASGETGQRSVNMGTGVTTARFTVSTDNDTAVENAG